MKRRLCYLLLCFIASIGWVSAQTTRVTGTVVSADDGEPIIGASVMVVGTTTGTITDINGAFSLNVPSGAKALSISYVGMETQEVAVRPNLTVRLNPDTHAIDEVIVTALGISREKKSLGYAIQEVKSEELTKAGQLSLTGSLSGKIAGVQVNQFGGTVGASSRIVIRGNSSFATDQQPLIVVDGVPISNDTQRTGDNYYVGVDYGSGLNDINPEDIESTTVLKGGSAALYGMRAGRGVILITTKSGKNAKGVSISYDGNMTFSQVANMPKMQNLYGQGHNGDELYWQTNHPEMSYQEYAEKYGFNFNGVNTGYDESWGPRLDIGLKIPQFDSPQSADGTYQATDWISRPNNIRDFFQTGYAMNHTVSVLSQSDRATTRASLSFRDEEGTIPNSDQKRYSAQLNTNMKLNDKVNFDMIANYTRTQSDNLIGQGYGDNNPINSLTVWSGRQINMQALKDNWDQKDAAGNYTYYNWIDAYHMNPYFTVYKNTNSMKRNRLFGKASLFYQPFEFLKVEARSGLDYYNIETFERYLYHWNNPEGSFEQHITDNTELNLDLLATFNRNFGDFSVSATLGANYRDLVWEYNALGANQLTVPGVYTLSNKIGDAIASMDHSHIRSNSVYGTASVGWKNQLYLDASARNDWSSTIRDDFFYPSASLSWIPTESFSGLKNDVLSFLKLRAGISQVGSATSAYRNRAYYYAESTSFNGVAQMYRSMTFPNPGLRPENIASWEGGIEVGLFDDRLHADVAYYQKVTTDQIMSVPTSYTIGFSSMLINAGKIENKGIEIQLRGDILKDKQGLNWTGTLNFSRDKSKIVELAPDYPQITATQLGWTWGIPNQALKGEEWGVLVTNGYDRVSEEDVQAGLVGQGVPVGAIKVTESGLVRSKAGVRIAHVTPKFLTGWRNDFTYKDVSFGVFLDMRVGGEIWSQSMSHSYTTGVAAITAEDGIRERMILPGRDMMKDETFVMQDADGKWVPNTIEVTAQDWYENGGVNEMYVFDGSFLKLREAYLSYTFPQSLLKQTKYISKATVSLIGSNLALLWVHKSNTLRLDPETGGVSSDTRGVGYEQASVPNSRNFGIKIGLTF
ncbi:MAG: SusC/RagA family TonB-linked outer membrane protein [Bacteroidales bacterium]